MLFLPVISQLLQNDIIAAKLLEILPGKWKIRYEKSNLSLIYFYSLFNISPYLHEAQALSLPQKGRNNLPKVKIYWDTHSTP